MRGWLWIAVVACVSACAGAPKRVDREMVIPFGAARHEVSDEQLFIMAVPIHAPDPEFPAGMRAPGGRLPVCVSFVVTGEGVVEAVELVDLPACSDTRAHAGDAFGQAVVSTVSGWSYFGAAVCDFTGGAIRNDDCEGEGVQITPVAIRLTYVFTFDSTAGKGRVSSERRLD